MILVSTAFIKLTQIQQALELTYLETVLHNHVSESEEGLTPVNQAEEHYCEQCFDERRKKGWKGQFFCVEQSAEEEEKDEVGHGEEKLN